MARYKLLEAAYCKRTPGNLIEEVHAEGTEIELPDSAIPGPHMEPLDAAARTAMDKFIKEGAPLDAKKVASINMGLALPSGAHLPPLGGADLTGATALHKMQELLERQAQRDDALLTALRALAA